jgi:hypothetical protein
MNIISQASKDANRIEFDRVASILSGQGIVISKIKNEITTMYSKFTSMIDIIQTFPDKLSNFERELYDTQVQGFLHACFMYLNLTDSNSNPYIRQVSPTEKTTDIIMTVSLPHYTTTRTLFSINNITVDIYNWDIFFGATIVNILDSNALAGQYSVIAEVPEQYFSKTEFIMGVAVELEKMIYFETEICRTEQLINSGLRYISELKNMGLYN